MKLSIHNLKKSYGPLEILKNVSLEVAKGEQLAVIGESGAGKSTFFNLLAGLDQFQSGEIFLGEFALHQLDEIEKAKVRGAYVGIVFQDFHLVPALSALENVRLVLDIHHKTKPLQERNEIASAMLSKVGLGERLNHRPGQLSGGEQQRVAIARALVHQPPVVLADEPTGNLDEKTSEQIQDLLLEMCEASQSSLILITHDSSFAQRMQKRYKLSQGELHEC